MDISPISRNAANAAGLRKYYTGRPCIYGHDSQRWVINGICCTCGNIRQRKYSHVKRQSNIMLNITVRVWKADAEQITTLAAMLNAGRDAKAAADAQAWDASAAREALEARAKGSKKL